VETTEVQVIVPKYFRNDEIVAFRHIWNGGPATYPAVQGGPEVVSSFWVDGNFDGRAWAKKA
jgi:hypothetical protein